jgi:hypothetical protein
VRSAAPTFRPGLPGVPQGCAATLIAPFRISIDGGNVRGQFVGSEDVFDVVWPPGFTIQGFPQPAVLDPDGQIVAQPGETIDDAGGDVGVVAAICSIGGKTYPLK